MLNGETYRRHPRVREDIPVRWSMEQDGRRGEGVIRNLSISGALLESRALSFPVKDASFILEAVHPEEAGIVPHRVRLAWRKSLPVGQGYYFCGVEFLASPLELKDMLEKRVEHRMQETSHGQNVEIVDKLLT